MKLLQFPLKMKVHRQSFFGKTNFAHRKITQNVVIKSRLLLVTNYFINNDFKFIPRNVLEIIQMSLRVSTSTLAVDRYCN